MTPPLTSEEERVVQQWRQARDRYENFTLSIYGQGSVKRRIQDMEVRYRVRLSVTEPLSLAVED